jgi:predicted Ser/Thr protein kinase
MSDKQRRKDLWIDFIKALHPVIREFNVTEIQGAVLNAYKDYVAEIEEKANEHR